MMTLLTKISPFKGETMQPLTLDQLFECYQKMSMGKTQILALSKFDSLGDFLEEYYRRGYEPPQNPYIEDREATIDLVAKIFKNNGEIN